MMRLVLSSLFFLLLAAGAQAQHFTECSAQPDAATKARMDLDRPAIQTHTEAFLNGDLPEVMMAVPIQLHAIRRSDGTGGLTGPEWATILQDVNQYYAPANLQFYNCAAPNFIDDDTYFDFDASSEQTPLSNTFQVEDVINVYVPGGEVISFGGGPVCGYAYYPWSSTDLIVTAAECMTNGSTFIHELGHYFGLYHTHGVSNCGSLTDELVDGSNCTTRGDDVCDTPADPNLRGMDCEELLVDSLCQYVGTLMDANGDFFNPDPNNIMSYSPSLCRDYLSPGQLARANFYALGSRDYLTCTPPTLPSLAFNLPSGTCGLTGDTLLLPITVSGFEDILNFQFSIGAENPAIGRLLDVSFLNLPGGTLGAVLNDSTATLVWDNNTGFSLEDGDTIALLSINVMATSEGTSALLFSGSPTTIYAETGSGLPVTPLLTNGDFSRCQTVSVRGNISRQDGQGLANVSVALLRNNQPITFTTTDPDGEYLFPVVALDQDYSIVPLKDTNYLNGVNAGDLSRIQQSIISLSPLVGYNYVAGDVSQPGSLNSGDLSRIRRLILGDITAFPDVNSWRFVASDHVFPDPAQPTSTPLPTTRSYNALQNPVVDANFIGVKMGDVNNTASTGESPGMANLAFQLQTSGPPLVNQAYSVEVTASGFTEMLATQFSIGWDSTLLAFNSVNDFAPALNLSGNNFSFQSSSSGRLPWVWFGSEALSLEDTTVLFRINFTVLAQVGDSVQICFTELPTTFYFEDSQSEIDATFGKVQTVTQMTSGLTAAGLNTNTRLFPNPTNSSFRVQYDQSGSSFPETVELYNGEGRLLKRWSRADTYDLTNFAAGVYFVKVIGAQGAEVLRLVKD